MKTFKLREMVTTKNLTWPAGLEVTVEKNSDPFCVVRTMDGWFFTTRLNNLEPVAPVIDDVEYEWDSICS